jgi:hypothetical protein
MIKSTLASILVAGMAALAIACGGTHEAAPTQTHAPTPAASPTAAPAVETLAYIRDGDVWLIDSDRSNERRLTQLGNVQSFSWVSADELDVTTGTLQEQTGHLAVDLEGNATELPFPAGGSWSRDGTRYVVPIDANVVVFDRQGAELAQLEVTPPPESGEKARNCRPPYQNEEDRLVFGIPVLSPDNDRVLIAVDCAFRGGMRNHFAPVYEVSLDGTVNQQFAGLTDNLGQGATLTAAFSPDGTHVAQRRFDGVNACGGISTLYVADDGTAAREITIPEIADLRAADRGNSLLGGIIRYDWSPDSTSVVASVFVYGCGDGVGPPLAGLYVIPLDGSQARKLVVGRTGDPDWSPSGRLIAYTPDSYRGETPGPAVIRLFDLSTGQMRDLAEGAGPAWQPQ